VGGRGRIEGWRTVEAHCATRRIAPPPHGEHSYELTQPPVEVFNEATQSPLESRWREYSGRLVEHLPDGKRMTGLPGTWQSVDDDPVAPFGATDTPAPVPPVSPAVISDDSGASTEPDLNAALSGMAMLLHVALRLMKA